MVTKDDIINLLFQIGFRELDEHEIVFYGLDDKILWKKGLRRYFEYGEYNIEIDYSTNQFEMAGKPTDKTALYFSTSFHLDDIHDIYLRLKTEFKSEMRKITIQKLLR